MNVTVFFARFFPDVFGRKRFEKWRKEKKSQWREDSKSTFICALLLIFASALIAFIFSLIRGFSTQSFTRAFIIMVSIYGCVIGAGLIGKYLALCNNVVSEEGMGYVWAGAIVVISGVASFTYISSVILAVVATYISICIVTYFYRQIVGTYDDFANRARNYGKLKLDRIINGATTDVSQLLLDSFFCYIPLKKSKMIFAFKDETLFCKAMAKKDIIAQAIQRVEDDDFEIVISMLNKVDELDALNGWLQYSVSEKKSVEVSIK